MAIDIRKILEQGDMESLETVLRQLIDRSDFRTVENVLSFIMRNNYGRTAASAMDSVRLTLQIRTLEYLKKNFDKLDTIQTILEDRQKPSERMESIFRKNNSFGSHFHEHYPEWRVRRQWKIMQLVGMALPSMRILEIGCGIGAVGALFAELGASVVALEGRPENALFATMKYGYLNNYRVMNRDVTDGYSDLGQFDLVINLGLLEVLKSGDKISRVLNNCCDVSSDIIVETIVYDSLDDEVSLLELSATGYGPLVNVNSSARVYSTIPSPKFVESRMEEQGFDGTVIIDPILNFSGWHRYDWQHNDDLSATSRRRFWRFRKSIGGDGGLLMK